MSNYLDILNQGYWWLSFIGGVHCLALALGCLYLYQDKNGNHKVLASLFSLTALYFFSGALPSSFDSMPSHLVLTLLFPLFFLVMPLLYIYCFRGLHSKHRAFNAKLHFIPALFIGGIVIFTISYTLLVINSSGTFSGLPSIHYFNSLSTILLGLLSIQAVSYFYLILRMLNNYSRSSHANQRTRLEKLKYNWLLMLTLTLMCSWVIKAILIMLPFYFKDAVAHDITMALNHIGTKVILLIAIYYLSLYGIKQYIRSTQAASDNAQSANQYIDAEEMDFLQFILSDTSSSEDSKKTS